MAHSESELRALLASWLGPRDIVHAVSLGGGTYNEAWRVGTTEHGSVVVKVAPDPGRPALRYERGLMANEVAFYRQTQGRGWCLPGLLAASTDGPRAWLAMEAVTPGPPLAKEVVDAQLGRLMAQLHGVQGAVFGYAHHQALQSSSWSGAFGLMLQSVLDDADRFQVELPVPPETLSSFHTALRPELDTVAAPALVHFDLWDGNVLHTQAGICVIDPERCFWGDPVAEFVSPALFADITSRPALLSAYREASGRDPLSETSARVRWLLYACYLFTIMLVEATPRASHDEGVNAFVTSRLKALVSELASELSA